MNAVLISGNLGRDIELKTTTTGIPVVSFSVATKVKLGDKDLTAWIDCEAWRKDAEKAAVLGKKGVAVTVAGYLKVDSWDDKETGKKRSRTKVVAQFISFDAPSEAPEEDVFA